MEALPLTGIDQVDSPKPLCHSCAALSANKEIRSFCDEMRKASIVDLCCQQEISRFCIERSLYASELCGHYVDLLIDKVTGYRVVLKRIKKRVGTTSELTSAVNREVTISMQLGYHENIVDCYNWTETPEEFLILMEYAPQPLYFVMRLEECNDPLYLQPNGDVVRLKAFACDLFRGLEHLHKERVVHLDIKPDNLLLQNSTKGLPILKICDFGLSQKLDHNGEVLLVSRCGTEPYIAPEVGARRSVTSAADIWSAGVFLHKLAVGFTPYSIRGWIPGNPLAFSVRYWMAYKESGLTELLSRCLVKDPGQRLTATEALAHRFLTC